MANITISKASLSAGLFLKVSYEEHLPGNSTRNHPNMTSTDPVHEDLQKLFLQLPAHMALICEEITNEDYIMSLPEDDETRQEYIVEMGESVPAIAAKKLRGKQTRIVPDPNAVDKPELAVDKFKTDSITIKSHGGSFDEVALSGVRVLTTGKTKTVGSPMTKLTDDEYKYHGDLQMIVEAIKYEINEFLYNGKKAPERQGDLFGDGIGTEEHTIKTNAYRDVTESINESDDIELTFPGGIPSPAVDVPNSADEY